MVKSQAKVTVSGTSTNSKHNSQFLPQDRVSEFAEVSANVIDYREKK